MSLREKMRSMVADRRISVRVGTMNILGWHHTEPGGKNAGMDDGVIRALRAFLAWNAAGCWVVVVTEMEKIQADTIERHSKWKVIASGYNNLNVRVKGNWMATVVCYKSRFLKVVEVVDLESPLAGRPRGLHMPAVRFKVKWLPIWFWVIGVHMPRLGGNENPSDSIAARDSAKQRHTSFMSRRTGPFVVAGDTNGFALAKNYGMTLAQEAGVEEIAVDKGLNPHLPMKHDNRRIGDHAHWCSVAVWLRLKDKAV